MGKTIIEKIFSSHSDRNDIHPGDVLWLDVDVRSARDFGGPNVVNNLRRYFPDNPVKDIHRTVFTFDTVAPANNIPYAKNQQLVRLFAREFNIPLFDVNRGIGTHTLIEEGWVRPGMIAVGTDSHYNIMGAIGAFGQGMGDKDIAFAFATGKIWFQVPPTVRVNVNGYPKNRLVTPKDFVLALLDKFGSHGLLGMTVELYGDYIDSLDLSGRITVASMGTEMALISIIIPPDEKLIATLDELSSSRYEWTAYKSDPDAKFVDEYSIDITDLEPLLSAPYSPDNVHPVREFIGTEVDSVFVGSCTNGRSEDITASAEALGDSNIAERTIMRVVPATRIVTQQIMESGIWKRLFDSGAVVSHPACGGCAQGQIGMTGAGEIQLSTGNRNFKGKQGAGETYLLSPIVAGFSAAKGKIWLPDG
ncbi:homoaconitate hydratase family protein [bacterium]|nr:MAG: homoaconitate hydratase family protein [bacterium]